MEASPYCVCCVWRESVHPLLHTLYADCFHSSSNWSLMESHQERWMSSTDIYLLVSVVVGAKKCSRCFLGAGQGQWRNTTAGLQVINSGRGISHQSSINSWWVFMPIQLCLLSTSLSLSRLLYKSPLVYIFFTSAGWGGRPSTTAAVNGRQNRHLGRCWKDHRRLRLGMCRPRKLAILFL